MTADLFSMPTLPQKPPSSFQSDKPGAISSDPSSTTEAPGWSKGDKHESFLSTLKEVSRDGHPPENLRPSTWRAAASSDKTVLHSENVQEIDIDSTLDETLIDIMTLLLDDEASMRDDEASIKDQTPVAAGLKELMALLEEAGLNGSSAEQMMMPGAGLTLENTSGSAGKGQNPLVALKQLIGEIQPRDVRPGSDMSTGLERLRLFIADALAAGSSAPGGGKLTNPLFPAVVNCRPVLI